MLQAQVNSTQEDDTPTLKTLCMTLTPQGIYFPKILLCKKAKFTLTTK
jgi:hypothetical protein